MCTCRTALPPVFFAEFARATLCHGPSARAALSGANVTRGDTSGILCGVRRSLAAATLTVWAAAWAACSTFESASPNDAPDAAANDAPASPPTDAPVQPSDGEATDAGDDGACTAFFCDGFERDADLANGWSEVTVPRFADLSLSTENARSGKSAMRLLLHGDAGLEAGRTAQLVRNLPPTATRVVLDFWLFYKEPPSSDTTLANVTLGGNDGNIIVLMRPAGGFVLAEQYRVDGSLSADNDVGVGALGNNKHRHITLEVGSELLDGGRAGAKLTVDDDARFIELENPVTSARPERAWIGSGYSQPGARNEDGFWFDDVSIEATPR
jgi:hypothetical protein